MSIDIEDIPDSILKFDIGDRFYLEAIKQYDQYSFKYWEPYIKIRNKDRPKVIYTVKLSYRDTDALVRCDCPAYVKKNLRPCKHCFMVALNYFNRWLIEKESDEFPEALQTIILDDYEALRQAPMISTGKLTAALHNIQRKVPKKAEPVTEPDDDWETDSEPEKLQQFKDEVKDIVTKPETLPAVKATKAFGGTVRDIPKNLVITLGGKPYVTKAGLIYAASQMGLIGIETEPMSWSWDNDDGRAVFKATVTFKDGKKFSAFGVAIPDGENIKMKQMYPFVDHLAETRAVGRALRNAMAFREPSIEEMADYEETNK